jgi:hypothetical protein
MNINRIKLKVRKEEGICKKCGEIRKFYYLSDFSYGERLILIKGGKDYAYVNLLEDNAFEKLEEVINLVLKKYNITLNKMMFAKCINKLFGLTCDMIDKELVYTANINEKCQHCGYDKFLFGADLKEAIVDIEVPVVTHFYWNSLNESDKLKAVENELRKLSYIN